MFGVRSLGSTVHFLGLRVRILGFRVFWGFRFVSWVELSHFGDSVNLDGAQKQLVEVRFNRNLRPTFLEDAMVCGRAWYKLLEAPILILDVTV